MSERTPHTSHRARLTNQEADSGSHLLLLMGNILGTWQVIEHSLADLFLVFFRPSGAVDPAAVAFYAIKTFDSRLNVVNDMVKQFCSEPLIDEWAVLLKSIRKQSTKRNAIAHGSVFRHGPSSSFVIGPSQYDIARFPENPRSTNNFYTLQQLGEICGTILSVREAMEKFLQQISADPVTESKLALQRHSRNQASHPMFAESATNVQQASRNIP